MASPTPESETQMRERVALEVLKANPLRREPWMTPLERCDWVPRFRVAAAAGSLGCWGVREALRFRAASAACRQALDFDDEWRALLLLSRRGRMLPGVQTVTNVASTQAWAAAHEKTMHFCLQDPTFDVRLRLGGIDDGLAEEYSTHPALKFVLGHTCLAGAVAHVQLGYRHGTLLCVKRSDWSKADWSAAPTDFLHQFENRATSLHVVVHCRGKDYTLAEAFAHPNARGITGEMVNETHSLRWFSDLEAGVVHEYVVDLDLYIPAAAFCHFAGIGDCPRCYPTPSLGSWGPTALSVDASLPSSSLSLIGVLWSSLDDGLCEQHNGFAYRFHGEFILPPEACAARDIRHDVPVVDRARVGLIKMIVPLALGGELTDEAARELRTCALELARQLVSLSALERAGAAIPPLLQAHVVRALSTPLRAGGHDTRPLVGMAVGDALEFVADVSSLEPIRLEASINPISDEEWDFLDEDGEVDRLSLWAIDALGRTRFSLHGLKLGAPTPRSLRRTSLEDDEGRGATGMNGDLHVRFLPGRLRLTFIDRPSAQLVLGETCGALG